MHERSERRKHCGREILAYRAMHEREAGEFENATEEIKMPAKGDIVEVFDRPLTREDSVGKGKVLKITWDGTWYDGGIVATVTLKLKGDTIANTWALWVPQD